jgi:hypothetical protein
VPNVSPVLMSSVVVGSNLLDVFFWAVVSDEIDEVIEFFPTRGQAGDDAMEERSASRAAKRPTATTAPGTTQVNDLRTTS